MFSCFYLFYRKIEKSHFNYVIIPFFNPFVNIFVDAQGVDFIKSYVCHLIFVVFCIIIISVKNILEAIMAKKERKEKRAKREKFQSTFWSDFKKFITKGNVIDMAVAVVIGAAFGKITTGLVNFIITPLTSIFLGEIDLTGIKTVITPEVLDEAGEVVTAEIAILWGSWLQAIIDFLIIAFVIFVILRIIMQLKNKLNEDEIAEAAAAAAEAQAKADAEAAAAAEQVAAEKARLEAREAEFYANVAKQTELLEEIRNSVKK